MRVARAEVGAAGEVALDSGAYARFSPYGVTKHAFHHSGAYTIPNLHFDGFVVFTNRVPSTAMRGFGVTSVSFAVETHLNRIAAVLGIGAATTPAHAQGKTITLCWAA